MALLLPSKLTGLEEDCAGGAADLRVMFEKVIVHPAGDDSYPWKREQSTISCTWITLDTAPANIALPFYLISVGIELKHALEKRQRALAGNSLPFGDIAQQCCCFACSTASALPKQ